jgi:hypothetical protein
VAAALLLVVMCVSSGLLLLKWWPPIARKRWKENAIPIIAKWTDDKRWRTQEIELLKTQPTNARVIIEGWLTDKLMLMQTGEWLIFKSHCSKESPHLVKDIFLAKGSDQKWYYSTFHFCVGMVVLRGEQETQPTNLAWFVHEYNLREFDGRSDECLKETKTWPASWDENKNTNNAGAL